jgi:nicotinate-nucleotide adenylyltransferase
VGLVAADCVVVLGGSFDPIHNGHVALATYFTDLLAPAALRVIPAGNPWQKNGLHAAADQRVAMIARAFAGQAYPVSIDQQEIHRHGASYSIDTLRNLRAEVGPLTSLAFVVGADQLQMLHTWREWRALFDCAHICVASRPGFTLDPAHMHADVAAEFTRRAGSAQQIRSTPQGLSFIGNGLAIDISATDIRAIINSGARPGALVPPTVLDYIQQHHLYQS